MASAAVSSPHFIAAMPGAIHHAEFPDQTLLGAIRQDLEPYQGVHPNEWGSVEREGVLGRDPEDDSSETGRYFMNMLSQFGPSLQGSVERLPLGEEVWAMDEAVHEQADKAGVSPWVQMGLDVATPGLEGALLSRLGRVPGVADETQVRGALVERPEDLGLGMTRRDFMKASGIAGATALGLGRVADLAEEVLPRAPRAAKALSKAGQRAADIPFVGELRSGMRLDSSIWELMELAAKRGVDQGVGKSVSDLDARILMGKYEMDLSDPGQWKDVRWQGLNRSTIVEPYKKGARKTGTEVNDSDELDSDLRGLGDWVNELNEADLSGETVLMPGVGRVPVGPYKLDTFHDRHFQALKQDQAIDLLRDGGMPDGEVDDLISLGEDAFDLEIARLNKGREDWKGSADRADRGWEQGDPYRIRIENKRGLGDALNGLSKGWGTKAELARMRKLSRNMEDHLGVTRKELEDWSREYIDSHPDPDRVFATPEYFRDMRKWIESKKRRGHKGLEERRAVEHEERPPHPPGGEEPDAYKHGGVIRDDYGRSFI